MLGGHLIGVILEFAVSTPTFAAGESRRAMGSGGTKGSRHSSVGLPTACSSMCFCGALGFGGLQNGQGQNGKPAEWSSHGEMACDSGFKSSDHGDQAFSCS